MGLPQHQQPLAQEESAQFNHSTTSASTTVDQLPPEAIALATRIFNYAREGKTAELRQYIEAGIPVNLTNHKGDTLIMLAAYHGNAETVSMLLEKHADANVLNERGQSPLAGAVFKGYDMVVKALFEAGADVQAGQPNAVDLARMFRKQEYLTLFGIQAAAV